MAKAKLAAIYRPVAHLSGRAFSVVSWLALIAGITLMGILPFFGFHSFALNGGSMEPTIPFGSLVVDGPGVPQVGDVITLHQANGAHVTHRVIAVQGDILHTKGDANEHADPNPVQPAELVGIVRVFVPGLGYVLGMLTDPWGIVSLICAWSSVKVWPHAPKDLDAAGPAGEPAPEPIIPPASAPVLALAAPARPRPRRSLLALLALIAVAPLLLIVRNSLGRGGK
jgi:signal peptidase I